MINFLKGLFLLVLLLSLGASSWFCWILWQDCQRLDSEKTALEVERALLKTDVGLCDAELRRAENEVKRTSARLQTAMTDKESFERKLAVTAAACEKAQEEARRFRYEKENAVCALTAELERQKKIVVPHPLPKPVVQRKVVPAVGDVEVESLQQLLDMTDHAPRQPSQRP